MAYTSKTFEAVNLNTSWALYTCRYSFSSCWHKYRKQNMSAKQVIHKWSLIIKNKYGCQFYSIDAYYCRDESLLVDLFIFNSHHLVIT